MTTTTANNCLRQILAPIILLASSAFLACAGPGSFGLCSPKNGDHFEVTKPLLFWQTGPGVKSYVVFIDDRKTGKIPAASIPVINYAVKSPLSVGLHHWFVKAISTTGDVLFSSTNCFTIDPPGNWPSWAIGPFVRYGNNPILQPRGTNWESRNTYNPGVLFDGGRFRMLYRAQGKPVTSREGYAESVDGVTFVRNPGPIIDATEVYEQKYGCEDARFIKYQGIYRAFYTGNIGDNIALCEATSTNGSDWSKLGPVVKGTKNGALVCDPNGTPVKIDGRFVMYVGNSRVGVCHSDDLITWSPVTWIDMKFPPGWVTPYEPCVAVANHSAARPDDIVVFIAGTLNGKDKWFYAISEVLFSKANLSNKADQLNDCILKPREPYESGEFKNCLWMNCIIQHNHQWMMYYGAGDRNIGLATAPVPGRAP